MEFGNITYTGGVSKFVESQDDPNDMIFLHKDIDYFRDENYYAKFVKKCESIVRQTPHYKKFISWVKNVVGINFCQVSSQIYDTDATIEMHHGPIFTLYDICSIVLNDFLRTNRKIDTILISKQVIKEHYDVHVQVTMLTTTNHEAAHNRDLFLNLKQGIGDIDTFIKIYRDSLDDIHKYKIWNYVNMCKDNPSFDKGYLDIDWVQKNIKL